MTIVNPKGPIVAPRKPKTLKPGTYFAPVMAGNPCWIVNVVVDGSQHRPIATVHHHDLPGAIAFACAIGEAIGEPKMSIAKLPKCYHHDGPLETILVTRVPVDAH